ncbi:hypothetical protein [Hydrogenophaga sp.]|uniref:hypothetical protein n=1 Tax=Hydrogenophaga sp. TaxID=1904254 RepID=UPI003D0CF5E5
MSKSKLSILVVTLAMLAGCATAPTPVQLEAASARSAIYGVATLAKNDCEAQTAADYTGVIVARRQAASLLRAKKIPVATAVNVQRLADEARAALDAACPGGRPDPEAIAVARAARAQIIQALEAPHAP